jgi:hypothetical protein
MKVSFSFEVAIEVMIELVSQHQVSYVLLSHAIGPVCSLLQACIGPVNLSSDVYCLIVVLTINYYICFTTDKRNFHYLKATKLQKFDNPTRKHLWTKELPN